MFRKAALALALGAALGLAAGTPALAKNNKNQGNSGNAGQSRQGTGDIVLDAVITAAEIAIIAGYIDEYGTAPFGAPQGLPPGIAKNLARGKPLPPGIAKRYLPGNLLGRLPSRPGYEWLVVDNDILLVVAATSIIVDVLNDAF